MKVNKWVGRTIEVQLDPGEPKWKYQRIKVRIDEYDGTYYYAKYA